MVQVEPVRLPPELSVVPRSDHEERVVEPLYDPATIRFGRFFTSEPPKRRMLIKDLMPLDIAGLIASMGGLGKSSLLYQLGISVATGVPFLGLPISQVGGVLYLAAEDDEDELHRRGLRIVEHYKRLGYQMDRGALSERLHIVSRVAEDSMLTRRDPDGEVFRTPLLERLIATAQKIPDLKLITLDPTSRFRGGRANDEEDSTRYVEALEAIRKATGAMALASIHVNKSSIREGGEADQSMVRGSTAVVDAARWVATMQRLRRDAAGNYGLDPSEASSYVRLDVVKNNYAAPWPGMWLRREAGGVLVPVELEERVEPARQRKADAEYDAILELILALVRDRGPLTRNALRDHATRAGRLKAGDKTVRSVVERALDEERLTLDDSDRLAIPQNPV